MNVSERHGIVVTAFSVLSPVGLDAVQTCASLRAGISRFSEHPFYRPALPDPPLSRPEGARVAAAACSGVGSPLAERLMQLSLAPMKTFLGASRMKREDLHSTCFFLSLPGPKESGPRLASSQDFARRYLERLGVPTPPAPRIYEEGHTGMLSALTEAAGLLHQGICRFCVIVGAESYLDRETLGWLDETYRLKSERNVDGFVPGECAVLLLVELEQHARRRGATSRARLTGLGRAMEKQTLWSNRYSTSEGLGQAFGQALGQSSTEAIHWTICDLNGESYRSQEWGTTRFRLAERFDPGLKLWHPSDCIGDIGAASGGLHIVMACRAFERHYAPDDRALIWCSSDGGTRAACVVMKPN